MPALRRADGAPTARLGACVLALTTGACQLYVSDDDAVIDARAGGRPPADAVPDDAPTDADFAVDRPAAPTRANLIAADGWVDDGPADWTCLGLPRDVAAPEPVGVSGHLVDWWTGEPIAGRSITAFTRWSPTPILGTAMSAATSDPGAYAAELAPLPAGASTRYDFGVDDADPELTGYLLEQYLVPGVVQTRDLRVITGRSAATLPGFLVDPGDLNGAVIGGEVVDCRGRRVSNALVVLSASPMELRPATTRSFYFSAGAGSVPVGANVAFATSLNGRYINFAPPLFGEPTFVQAWGFRTAAEQAAGSMTLLAVVQLTPQPRSTTVLTLEPRQSG